MIRTIPIVQNLTRSFSQMKDLVFVSFLMASLFSCGGSNEGPVAQIEKEAIEFDLKSKSNAQKIKQVNTMIEELEKI